LKKKFNMKHELIVDKNLGGVELALMNGCCLHSWRSGGGLRVVRLDKDGKGYGYGEHPYIDVALQHANEDYLAGGRDYHKVYGELYDHYLTGAFPTGEDELDSWVYQGQDFDAWYEDGQFVVELRGWEQWQIPKDIQEYVLKTKKPRIFTTGRGWELECSIYEFANGELGVQTQRVRQSVDKDGDPFMWKIKKVGKSNSLVESIQLALKSEGEEVEGEL